MPPLTPPRKNRTRVKTPLDSPVARNTLAFNRLADNEPSPNGGGSALIESSRVDQHPPTDSHFFSA